MGGTRQSAGEPRLSGGPGLGGQSLPRQPIRTAVSAGFASHLYGTLSGQTWVVARGEILGGWGPVSGRELDPGLALLVGPDEHLWLGNRSVLHAGFHRIPLLPFEQWRPHKSL